MGQKPPGRQEPTVLQVFIFQEGRFWGTECFAQASIVLGRSPDIDLQLDDDIISRSHAQVTVTDEGLVLEDLGSSNGTFVNGEPVERCYVDSRDEISIGAFTLKLKLLGKKRPVARFRDETRIVDGEMARDDRTEVVQPEAVEPDMVVGGGPVREAPAQRPEPSRARRQRPGERAPAPGRREQIAAALRQELNQDTGFDAPPTDRIDDAADTVAIEPDQIRGRDEYDVKTEVEQSPFPSEQPEPAKSEDGAPDHGTRWLTPDPTAGPPLELAGEPAPRPEPVASAPGPGPAEPFAPMPGLPAGEQLGRDLPADLPTDRAEPERSVEVARELHEPEPPLPGDWEEYDEEEEEEVQKDFVEPFSLLNNLIRENFAQPPVATESTPVVEVIGYSSEKQVLSYDQVAHKSRHRIGPKKFVLVRYNDQSACQVMFTDDFSGGVITGGRTVAVDELKQSGNVVSRRKGKNVYSYKLMKGDYANLIHNGGGSFIRFVHPPKLPPSQSKSSFDMLSLKIFGSAFLAHILFIVVLSFFAKQADAHADADIDRFAKVDVKDIAMEKPEEEAEVPLDQLPEPEEQAEEEKKEEEKKEEPKEEPKPEKKPKKVKRRSKRRGSGGGEAGDGGGGAGMMAALGNLKKKKSSHNIVAAVSNLDAVRVPGGRSRYKVSGVVTKLPTSGVVVSRGRGVGVKAGIDLLRGGKGRGGMAGIGPGALRGGRTGRRKVGGVVFKAPKRKMRVRGHLSREAIAKVVRKHLREVQYCYEKNLLLNPNLSGKLIMEWTITLSGSVSVVKTKSNTMRSPAVAMCISAKIKRWQFPRPKGGIVVVTYPFIFNSIGF